MTNKLKELRIIFMGTPDFAVPSLKILIKNYYNIVAVVTAPDKPAGRGLKLQTSPVKDLAAEHNIPVLQPLNLKSPEFLEELKSFNANLQIVVAFRMLPETVWKMPEVGTFNLHASLLPDYRGAAPINWAIINGETETGVTTFFLKHEIDSGDIIFQEKEPILPEDNFETLYGRLKNKGSELVLATVEAIQSNTCTPKPQRPARIIKLAPKIHKETCSIDWNKTSFELRNFIRGLAPYPGAWTEINGKSCKILRAEIANTVIHEAKEPGQFITDNKEYLYFVSADGMVSVSELQMEGKKKMNIKEFFRGNKL